MNKDINNMEQDVEDAIMERPYGFAINEQKFYLYPVSLGKSILLSRVVQQLSVDNEILKANLTVEALRMTKSKKDLVCRIIAICTINDKEELFNEERVSARSQFFANNLKDDEIAQMFLMLISYDRTDSFFKHFGIDKEQEEQSRIFKIKNADSNTISFGGKSLYGSLIGAACERFGWSFDYVVWGISLTNLRMLIADAVSSVYLSEEEKKKARVSNDRERINADDPASWARIKSIKWD